MAHLRIRKPTFGSIGFVGYLSLSHQTKDECYFCLDSDVFYVHSYFDLLGIICLEEFPKPRIHSNRNRSDSIYFIIGFDSIGREKFEKGDVTNKK